MFFVDYLGLFVVSDALMSAGGDTVNWSIIREIQRFLY